ncbi:MOSC N-terminal beta barrel domain-containing protein [Micromonospora echinaurantiaca]|uniref:MOSC N-terminal beta barrel domain-containing protein n=1 Tax=Micromonospora echinaurantiaca TaxID=47857 RepID=UPI00379FDFF9
MTGRLAQLWRYPVKSMLGERLTAAEVTATGVAGDRGLALVHRETGRVASAKHPRHWRGLLTLRASGAAPGPVRIILPDGRTVSSVDAEVDEVLSRVLGAPVTLTGTPPDGAVLDRPRPEAVLDAGVTADVPVDLSPLGTAAPGTFFDFAPIHLVTTATLRRLAAETAEPRGGATGRDGGGTTARSAPRPAHRTTPLAALPATRPGHRTTAPAASPATRSGHRTTAPVAKGRATASSRCATEMRASVPLFRAGVKARVGGPPRSGRVLGWRVLLLDVLA